MLVYDVNNLYNDVNYRIFSVFNLNIEAYKILTDSIIIKNYEEILEERIKLRDVEKRMTYDHPISHKVFKHYILENVKIAIALEIHLKSLLLFNGYIVHVIDKKGTLRKEQKHRPISITEYQSFYENDFNHLSENSLILTSFEKPGYSNVLELDADVVDILIHFKSLRNAVHLPINIPTGLPLEDEMIIRLVRYINENIIDFTYKIADDNHFNHNFDFLKF